MTTLREAETVRHLLGTSLLHRPSPVPVRPRKKLGESGSPLLVVNIIALGQRFSIPTIAKQRPT